MIDAPAPEPLIERLDTVGWLVLPSIFDDSLIKELTAQIEASLALRRDIRQRNRVDGNNDGTLHHLLGDHPCFVELLARFEQLDDLFKLYFRGNYILNSYGGVINRRDSRAYVHEIHRDIRFSSDAKRFMLNTLVMLDDFTLENGATHLLSGSQKRERPTSDDFLSRAERAVGKRGSLLVFDSRLWHAAGHSSVDAPRRALTLTFTSPFFKQQLDYPRMVGQEGGGSLSPYLRQVIGYNSRVPASLAEYYLPTSERFYQRGQDD